MKFFHHQKQWVTKKFTDFSGSDAKVTIAVKFMPNSHGYIWLIPSRTDPQETRSFGTARLVSETSDPLEGRTMMKFIKNFRKDEDGAVTVDWVVLTAAVVGLAVAAYSSIEEGATELTGKTSDFLSAQDPAAAAGGNIQGAAGGGDAGADAGADAGI
jgi:Flp pilus assembly pilin Flp